MKNYYNVQTKKKTHTFNTLLSLVHFNEHLQGLHQTTNVR